MKVLVLGSGVLGVTLAYVLGSRGHEVEIVDRCAACAMEASFSNGGQLSYSHAEPWATPAVLRKLPKWLLHEDSPLIFRPRLDWQMMRWGVEFLRHCTRARAEINTVNLLRLGLYSRDKMAVIQKESGITFDYAEKGILHVFGTQKELDAAAAQAQFQEKFGCRQNILSAPECFALEPALRATERNIIGGLHAFMDQTGDAQQFCVALLSYAQQKFNAHLRLNTEITSISAENGMITGVQTSAGPLKADAYVMALGSYSVLYLRPLGIRVPIYPMKGYSLTIPAGDYSPHVSITDGSRKIVYSRLGDRVRVAGTAEFAGYNSELVESRIEPIIRSSRVLFPKDDWDAASMTKWACLRPSTPDGPPILGPTPYRNLFLNTGHGTLGWTQAAGSAYVVADAVENRQPEIMLSGLTMQRGA